MNVSGITVGPNRACQSNQPTSRRVEQSRSLMPKQERTGRTYTYRGDVTDLERRTSVVDAFAAAQLPLVALTFQAFGIQAQFSVA